MRWFANGIAKGIGKRIGLVAVTVVALAAGPGTATAEGWRGGVAPAPGIARGGYAGPPAGWRGEPVVPAYRGRYVSPGYVSPRYISPGYAYPGYAYPGYVAPRYVAPLRPVARVWVPGYWNWAGDARVWVGGAWAYPPNAGWVWVAPNWAWNGYTWAWQSGYWTPPSYGYGY